LQLRSTRLLKKEAEFKHSSTFSKENIIAFCFEPRIGTTIVR
jgi:hypothetical protein